MPKSLYSINVKHSEFFKFKIEFAAEAFRHSNGVDNMILKNRLSESPLFTLFFTFWQTTSGIPNEFIEKRTKNKMLANVIYEGTLKTIACKFDISPCVC